MTKRSMTCLGLAVLSLAVSSTLAAEPLQVRGRIDAVTVYRGQALVTRVIDLPNETGLQDVIVTDLPAAIIAGSVYAEVEGEAQVRHVRPRTRAVMDDVREDVRKLDEHLAKLAGEHAGEQAHIDVLARHSQYLDKLEGFTAPTANTELTRGVLNAETLEKLTKFILGERQRVASETLTSRAKLADLAKQAELVNRQKNEITGTAQKTAREAVMMVDVKAAGAKVRLKYLVTNATWSPSYTVHATSGRGEVDLQYQAILSQMSGEDWTDVRMTLSTATPSVVARAPDLETLRIALAQGEVPQQSAVRAKGSAYAQELAGRRDEAAKAFMGNSANQDRDGQQLQFGQGAGSGPMGGFGSGVQRDNLFALNRAAGELQEAELVLDKSISAAARATPTESVTVTYVLADATSLPSRADQQLVGIASGKMKADFYKLAVPVLTSYVYNQADTVNASNQLLLAGPTMSYLDGDFVGAGELPTVAIGEQFTVGFGIDASLRATRELADKSESISGGNKIAGFEYAIAIENFGATAAAVRVNDRVPVAANKDMKVQVTSSDPKPVDDAELLRKRGLLRWDVQVKPQAIGPDATRIKYSLSIEHDRNLNLVGAAK